MISRSITAIEVPMTSSISSSFVLLLVSALSVSCSDSDSSNEAENGGSTGLPNLGQSALAGSAGTPQDATSNGGSEGMAGSGTGSGGSVSEGTGGMQLVGVGGTFMAGNSDQTGDAGSQGGAGGMGEAVAEACPASAVFCEDFEDDATGSFPGAPWTESVNGAGSVAVDTTRATSGNNAVLVRVPGTNAGGNNYERAFLQLRSEIFPAVATEMYGRAMMWLDETPDGLVHWTFIQADGPSGDGHDRMYRYGGQQQGGAGLMANYETNSGVSTDCWDHSASTMPTQQWTCVEWRFAVATNEMEFWLDGTNLEDIHVTDEGEGCLGQDLQNQWLAPPAFQSLSLGWERYQDAGNDRNLWLDDIVVSTERVGCAQ